MPKLSTALQVRVRLKTWWWGRYIIKQKNKWVTQDGETYPFNQVPTNPLQDSQWEIYDEAKHGGPK